MRNSRCFFSTTSALHHIFVAPVTHLQLPFIWRAPTAITTSRVRRRAHLSQQRRAFVFVSDAKAEKIRPARNHEITAPYISLIDEQNRMHERCVTREVLANLDFNTKVLVTLMPAENGKLPTCKIIDKMLLRQKEKNEKNKKKKKDTPKKTIELTWAIEKNDIVHRLRRIREFLEKGFKVDVLIQGKRRSRIVMAEEQQDLLHKIKQTTLEAGGKETKAMQGTIGVQVEIFLEGKKKKESKMIEQDLEEDAKASLG